MGESDIIRRYMSKKKTEKFLHYEKPFIDGMVAKGADPVAAKTFWDELVDFSKYAFNKSHAAAYAFVSYMTAWLKCYFFKEYICAAINMQSDKTSQLQLDCKAMNVKIYAPSVNESTAGFTTYESGIICGLNAIKGMSAFADKIEAERNANGKFVSLADFMERLNPPKNVFEPLANAGALDAFCSSRAAIVSTATEMSEVIKKIQKAQEKYDAAVEAAANVSPEDVKEVQKSCLRIKKNQTNLDSLIELKNAIELPMYAAESKKARLDAEKELIGMWLSADPLDDYPDLREFGCLEIGNAKVSKFQKLGGMVTGLRLVNRRSDGKKMAFFKLADKTGDIEVVCFANKFEKVGSMLEEGKVLAISGKIQEEEDTYNGDTSKIIKLYVTDVEEIPEKKVTFLITVSDFVEKVEKALPILMGYREASAHPFVIFDEMTGEFQKGQFTVSEKILDRKTLRVKVMGN